MSALRRLLTHRADKAELPQDIRPDPEPDKLEEAPVTTDYAIRT
jgi:hypothetical protein